MMLIGVIPQYLVWHYTAAPFIGVRLCRNLLFAINQLFPVPSLAGNLFAPWHRVTENTGKRFDLEDWAERLVVNMMSRLIGACARAMVIAVGIGCYVIGIAVMAIGYTAWVLAPVGIIGMFTIGIGLLL